jgi:predicted regulator of Ras-like GTPase activity (Roadblock/LC7/MglB family)
MIFEEVAKDAVERVYGALASLIMGRDGIPLSMYRKEGVEMDLEPLGIEYSNLLAQITNASQTIGSGDVYEMAVTTERYVILMRSINPEYFVCLIMSPDGNLGKGRYILRVNLPRLRAEL